MVDTPPLSANSVDHFNDEDWRKMVKRKHVEHGSDTVFESAVVAFDLGYVFVPGGDVEHGV